jgi:hypothetical protein
MQSLTHQKNTPLRNSLAKKLWEIRTWPPICRDPTLSLLRPLQDDTLSTVLGEVSLETLVQQGTTALDCVRDAELEQVGATTMMTPLDAASPLAAIFVKPVTVLLDADESAPALRLYRKIRSTDRQYAAHIAGPWQKFQRDSQVSDDTDARYREFLKLKAIYEPELDAGVPA